MTHLQSINLPYFSHLKIAFHYSFTSVKAALVFFIHGIFPDCFETTGSNIITSLYQDIRI